MHDTMINVEDYNTNIQVKAITAKKLESSIESVI